GALRPVLPAMTAEVETFLAAPLARWQDLDAPLTAHRIQAYQPLFTRIDPKQIAAMTEASKDDLKPTGTPPATPVAATTGKDKAAAASNAPPAPAAAGSAAAAPTIAIDDFAKLDLRIGKVLACEFVEGSDKLLR